jgi:hypothetical protein
MMNMRAMRKIGLVVGLSLAWSAGGDAFAADRTRPSGTSMVTNGGTCPRAIDIALGGAANYAVVTWLNTRGELVSCVSSQALQAKSGNQPESSGSELIQTLLPKLLATAVLGNQATTAQAQCFGSISSCRTISSTQRCHATEHVIYTKQGANWCKTPAPCTC